MRQKQMAGTLTITQSRLTRNVTHGLYLWWKYRRHSSAKAINRRNARGAWRIRGLTCHVYNRPAERTLCVEMRNLTLVIKTQYLIY